MRSLELRIPPVALVFVVSAAMAAFARWVPAAVPVPAQDAVALALFVAGGLVGLAGVVALRREATTVNPLSPGRASWLVTTGIYGFSRNPMYLGLLLALAGWCACLGNALAALFLPAFVLYMNRFQIEPEERALTERFGSRYLAYISAVRRWL